MQKKTIDEIVCDLSTQVKSTNDELRQHSLLLKKLQEDNHSLHKKNTKLAETTEDLLRKQTELEKEVVSLREQVMNLQQKPSEVPVSLPDTPDVNPDPKCQSSTNTSEEEHEEELIVTLPLENRFSILQEPGPQTKQNSLNSLSMDNKSLSPTNTNSVDLTHAVFLCDSNGKYLNTKMFPSNKNIEYFRCPTIAKARAIIHNDLSDSPQLLVIHTGTNDLTSTTPTDEFIADVSSFITEAATKFPKSKLIYSTLIPRGDIPAATITRINEQLFAGLSNLPNVHLVNHDNLFFEEIDPLHDTKHIKRRHIGLFASNLIAAIRGKTRKMRYIRSQSPLRPVPPERPLSYSHVLQNGSNHQISYRKSHQRQSAFSDIHRQHQDQPSAIGEEKQPLQNPDNKQKDSLDLPRELISFLRLMKSFI